MYFLQKLFIIKPADPIFLSPFGSPRRAVYASYPWFSLAPSFSPVEFWSTESSCSRVWYSDSIAESSSCRAFYNSDRLPEKWNADFPTSRRGRSWRLRPLERFCVVLRVSARNRPILAQISDHSVQFRWSSLFIRYDIHQICLIESHNIIILFGYGPSFLCAQYFEYRLRIFSNKIIVALSGEISVPPLQTKTRSWSSWRWPERFSRFKTLIRGQRRRVAMWWSS